MEVVRAGRSDPRPLAVRLDVRAQTHAALARLAAAAVTRLARHNLEAQPRHHATAASLHVGLVEAHVLVAGLGPVQAVSALRRVTLSGG